MCSQHHAAKASERLSNSPLSDVQSCMSMIWYRYRLDHDTDWSNYSSPCFVQLGSYHIDVRHTDIEAQQTLVATIPLTLTGLEVMHCRPVMVLTRHANRPQQLRHDYLNFHSSADFDRIMQRLTRLGIHAVQKPYSELIRVPVVTPESLNAKRSLDTSKEATSDSARSLLPHFELPGRTQYSKTLLQILDRSKAAFTSSRKDTLPLKKPRLKKVQTDEYDINHSEETSTVQAPQCTAGSISDCHSQSLTEHQTAEHARTAAASLAQPSDECGVALAGRSSTRAAHSSGGMRPASLRGNSEEHIPEPEHARRPTWEEKLIAFVRSHGAADKVARAETVLRQLGVARDDPVS